MIDLKACTGLGAGFSILSKTDRESSSTLDSVRILGSAVVRLVNEMLCSTGCCSGDCGRAQLRGSPPSSSSWKMMGNLVSADDSIESPMSAAE